MKTNIKFILYLAGMFLLTFFAFFFIAVYWIVMLPVLFSGLLLEWAMPAKGIADDDWL